GHESDLLLAIQADESVVPGPHDQAAEGWGKTSQGVERLSDHASIYVKRAARRILTRGGASRFTVMSSFEQMVPDARRYAKIYVGEMMMNHVMRAQPAIIAMLEIETVEHVVKETVYHKA